MRLVSILTVLALNAVPATAQSIRAEASPALPTTVDRVTLTLEGSSPCPTELHVDAIETGRIVLRFADAICDPPALFGFREQITVGPLAAGAYTVELVGHTVQPFAFTVTAPAQELTLQDGLFTARVAWRDVRSGQQGTASAVKLSEESGYFWFFDSANVEVTLKVLDGRLVNGHFWVFLASMTDVEVTTTVTSCPPAPILPPCIQRTYVQSAGHNRNFIDTAF
jgi:hypothetical protein